MGISSSALASLVIAGTAIGGSTIAVMANTSSSTSNISQLVTEASPSAKLPGATTAPTDPNLISEIGTPVMPSATPMPMPTATPTPPALPPINFGGGDDEDEEYDEGHDEDENEEEEYGEGSYDGDDEEDEDGDDD